MVGVVIKFDSLVQYLSNLAFRESRLKHLILTSVAMDDRYEWVDEKCLGHGFLILDFAKVS